MCLLKIRDVIHLYPLWSAALQANVERFAVDSVSDAAEQEAPTCRTNSVVESHFKSVKHGRMEGRSRVRPRAFVTAELKYVLGKLNERKLPKVKVQSKTAASTEEKWSRRKRPARYSDAAVASKRLKTIHRRMTPTATATAAPVKGEAASAAEHIAATARKTATTVQDVTSAVAATPASTTANVQMKELGDGDIMTAMDQLRAAYPDVDGLQHPGLGVCVAGHSMPRFKPVVRPFVQVLNIGDHWITATNMLTRNNCLIYWFDSLHGRNISPSTAMQLSSLLRRQTNDYIQLIHRACPLQYTWSRLCGYYALAAAYAVCSGSDPTGREYDAQTMVDVIDRNIQTGRVDQVPSATQGPAKTRMRQRIPKLHCNCHQPSAGKMIQCTNCTNWFHVDCVSVTARQLRRLSAAWNGPCCSQPARAPPVVIIDDTTSQPSSRPAPAAEEPGDLQRY